MKAIKFIHGADMCYRGKSILSCVFFLQSGRTALSNFSSDISSGNIAFTCNKVLSSPGQELFDVRGSLKVDPLPRKDSTPLDKWISNLAGKAAE